MSETVYEFLKPIPRGKVVTYGQIACFLGNKHLSRVVGNILHKNPDPANIPCHRVVNARGEVSQAYAFGGAEAQRRRLEAEGVLFSPDGRIDLNRYGMNL
jgi:O-6-methylguanine DNA methyltransferase